jgi:hypothetical protein
MAIYGGKRLLSSFRLELELMAKILLEVCLLDHLNLALHPLSIRFNYKPIYPHFDQI